jgi:sugar/nucleoside kinase (ribokinase family)
MEAVSARMGAQSRFGALGDPAPSQLQRYIRKWGVLYVV